MNSRLLIVSINGDNVGVLADRGGFWSFQYAPAWLASPHSFPISPSLSLKEEAWVDAGSQRPVQWFFDNLLPEEQSRVLLAKDAETDINDTWGLLEYFGAESAGALTLLPPGEATPPGGLRALSFSELERRIRNLEVRSLSADAPKRMSLAGAQHKLPIHLEGDALFEPVGAECSTHILKPNTRHPAYPNVPANEYFCMQLAAAMKITVPATRLLHVPSPVYIVTRFDRLEAQGKVSRLHALDGMQLLSLDRGFKYSQANVHSLIECIDYCRSSATARISIFRWVVFNILIGNGDAHLKNISFFLGREGIALAPFYDLVSTVVYHTPENLASGPHWPNVELSMNVGKANLFSEITMDDVLHFAQSLSMKKAIALRYVHELAGKIHPAAQRLYERVQQEARLTAGEERLIRAIINLPISEMSRRLAE